MMKNKIIISAVCAAVMILLAASCARQTQISLYPDYNRRLYLASRQAGDAISFLECAQLKTGANGLDGSVENRIDPLLPYFGFGQYGGYGLFCNLWPQAYISYGSVCSEIGILINGKIPDDLQLVFTVGGKDSIVGYTKLSRDVIKKSRKSQIYIEHSEIADIMPDSSYDIYGFISDSLFFKSAYYPYNFNYLPYGAVDEAPCPLMSNYITLTKGDGELSRDIISCKDSSLKNQYPDLKFYIEDIAWSVIPADDIGRYSMIPMGSGLVLDAGIMNDFMLMFVDESDGSIAGYIRQTKSVNKSGSCYCLSFQDIWPLVQKPVDYSICVFHNGVFVSKYAYCPQFGIGFWP